MAKESVAVTGLIQKPGTASEERVFLTCCVGESGGGSEERIVVSRCGVQAGSAPKERIITTRRIALASSHSKKCVVTSGACLLTGKVSEKRVVAACRNILSCRDAGDHVKGPGNTQYSVSADVVLGGSIDWSSGAYGTVDVLVSSEEVGSQRCGCTSDFCRTQCPICNFQIVYSINSNGNRLL